MIFNNITRKEIVNLIDFLEDSRLDYLGSKHIEKQKQYNRILYGEIYKYLIEALQVAYESDEPITTKGKEVPFYFKEIRVHFKYKQIAKFFKKTLICFYERERIIGYERNYIERTVKQYKVLRKAFRSFED